MTRIGFSDSAVRPVQFNEVSEVQLPRKLPEIVVSAASPVQSNEVREEHRHRKSPEIVLSAGSLEP